MIKDKYFYEIKNKVYRLYLDGKLIKETTQRTPYVEWFVQKAVGII
jgi:hypothetical protein